jgi:hypothetical protein
MLAQGSKAMVKIAMFLPLIVIIWTVRVKVIVRRR